MMASDSSFDIASKVDMQEVVNGIDIAMREILNRYDFKDSNTTIDLNKEDRKITIHSLDDYKVNASWDILLNKFAKRNVPIKAMKAGVPTTSGLNKTHMEIEIQDGIPQEKAKEIVKTIKDTKLKVQASIQKDVIRVSGAKKDDLQAVMAMLREKDFGVDMQFTNYR